MLENTQFAAERAGCSSIPVSQCYETVEIEQQQVSLLIAAFHRSLRVERRYQSLLSLASLWPVALGVLLGFYAPGLRDLVTNSAPWALNLLFPFSALVGERGLNLSWDTSQALAQFLLYAQFPLEGLLVRMVLKHRQDLRIDLFNVFGHVTCLHIFAVLYLVLVSGSLSQIGLS